MKKLIDIVCKEYGITEIVGDKHNKEVLKYYHGIGHKWVNKDETPWCAAFANWCLKQADLPYQETLNARSFLNIGYETENPKPFDVVVFWRKSKKGAYGHVAFYINEDDTGIYVLGGNQSNQVNIRKYPKNRLLGYRTFNK